MRLVAVEGPLAYVDVPTRDGRLLIRDGMLPMKEPYIPIIQWVESGCRPVTRGRLERVELWGNVLWGYGMAQVSGQRIFVSLGVHWRSRMDAGTLVFDEWFPRSVAVHMNESSPWENPVYLEGPTADD